MTRFYMSTGMENIEIAREVIAALESAGMQCTYDWTKSTYGGMIYTEEEQEVRGVKNADFMICVLPGGKGTHVELGIAIAEKVPIYLYAPSNDYYDEKNSKFCFFYSDRYINKQIYNPADTDWLIKSIEVAAKTSRLW